MYISMPDFFQAWLFLSLIAIITAVIRICSLRSCFMIHSMQPVRFARRPTLFLKTKPIEDEKTSFLQRAFNHGLCVRHQHFLQQLLFLQGCHAGAGRHRNLETHNRPFFFLGPVKKSERNSYTCLRFAGYQWHGRSKYQEQFWVFIDHRCHPWYLESYADRMEMFKTL